LQQVAAVRPVAGPYPENEQAFTDLLAPVIDSGFRLACAMLHDPQGARDAVQEASLTAWRKIGRLEDRAGMRSWFLGIVANECRNARRRKWISGVVLGLPRKLSARSPEDRILAGADLRRALARLRHRDRLVVVLFYYLDLPLEQVADIVGDSVSATRARLYRSIRRLRPDLDTEEALQ